MIYTGIHVCSFCDMYMYWIDRAHIGHKYKHTDPHFDLSQLVGVSLSCQINHFAVSRLHLHID